MIRNFVLTVRKSKEMESKKNKLKDYFYCFYGGQKSFQKFIFAKVVLRGLPEGLRLE